MDIKGLVESVQLPETNDYFEKTCSDGYAFLGMARRMMFLPINHCLFEMVGRVHGMNGPRKVNHINVPCDAVYTYCLCIDYEFLAMLGATLACKKIIDQLIGIGCYPSGMMRYCDCEVHYQVPNVTALAALTYAKAGYVWHANELLRALTEYFYGDNWRYCDTRTGKEDVREEDSHHVAIIIWALGEIVALYPKIQPQWEMLFRDKDNQKKCKEMVSKGLALLDSLNQPSIITSKHCSPGWNPAFVLAAATGLNTALAERALPICKKTIEHPNFRVRAVSAWALANYGRHYGIC